MNKKTRNLLVIVGILIVCVVVYLLIVKFTKNDEPDKDGDTTTSTVFWDLSEDTIVNLKIDNEGGTIEFSYDSEEGQWSYVTDSSYPVDNTTITSIVSMLKSLSYSRTIDDYTSLESYNLESPVVKISAETADGEAKELYFSSLAGSNNTYYFKERASDSVYITTSDFTGYGSYSIIDFIKIVDVPVFSSYDITDISFGSLDEGRITLEINRQATEENGKTTVWDYYTEKTGIEASEVKTALVEDTDVMMNYINEFTLNKAVSINPDESELVKYGINYDRPTVTINFTGKTNKINVNADGVSTNEIVDSEFTYKIFIGNAASDNKSQYYVAVSCIDAQNEDSIYNSSTIYTTNAIYAEYYLEFCEAEINGENRIKDKLLDEDDIPMLNAENIQTIKFSPVTSLVNDDNTVVVDFTGENTSYTLYNTDMIETQSGGVVASSETQMLEYFSGSGLLTYKDLVTDYKTDFLLEGYGLNIPERTVTVTFKAEYKDNNGKTTEYIVEWILYIGNKVEDESGLSGYYVTFDNTEHVYTMSESIVDYLLALNEDILNGTEVYGKSQIEVMK